MAMWYGLSTYLHVIIIPYSLSISNHMHKYTVVCQSRLQPHGETPYPTYILTINGNRAKLLVFWGAACAQFGALLQLSAY
jgi:hypothetical protein